MRGLSIKQSPLQGLLEGAKEEDFRPLIERRFVIVFDDGVLVIKHWRIHNLDKGTDRLQPTKYQQHKKHPVFDENNAYSDQPTGICQPSVRQLTDKCHTEVRLGKDSIDKDSKDTSSSEVATAPADKVKVSFEKDSRPYKCALYLANQIAERIPGKKYAEATLQSWAKDFDRVNRLDGHSWDDIGTVLTFSQNDSFWQGNILSGAKFRKQYDQLYLKMQKGGRMTEEFEYSVIGAICMDSRIIDRIEPILSPDDFTIPLCADI